MADRQTAMRVDFSSHHEGREAEITSLFKQTFTDSEGAEEGRLIGDLTHNLLTTTSPGDLFVFMALHDTDLLGSIFFTRMRFANEKRKVFILSPVAVRTDQQGQGVGQRLLRHGLQQMCAAGVDVALTYGDPEYYGKVGFKPISARMAAPPYALSQPTGWLGQSLTDQPLTPLAGASNCVPGLDDPAYW